MDQLGFIMAKVGLTIQAMQRCDKEINRGMSSSRVIGIRWSHPLDGWVKLNTDGASKGNPGQAGAGGIVRGRGGRPLSMFAENCGIASCTKAEFLAVLKELALVWNLGHRRVVLKVDSLVVARALLGGDIPSSPYYHVVRRCKLRDGLETRMGSSV